MELSRIYFSHLLKVNPIINNNIFNTAFSPKCNGIVINNEDRNNGISNSDLHIYIVYIKNTNIKDTISGGFCAINPLFERITFGTIKFNLEIINTEENYPVGF